MSIETIILGLIQGLLEWWPVSSTSVLIIVSKYFGLNLEESFLLAMILHLPTGLAAIYLFRKSFLKILSEVFRLELSKYTRSYILSLIVSITTGFPIYLLYRDLIRGYSLIALTIIGIGLIITTIVFFIKPSRKYREEISLKDWLVTGLIQGLSVIPGFSRSGLTIGYLCIRGYKPFKAVETSILLAIPILIAAGLYNIFELQYDLTKIFTASVLVFSTAMISGKLLVNIALKSRIYIFTLLLAILIFTNIILEIFL
ncbi:MAG: undecaprenyl-diphosphate phosphatase [Desulfurococcaceae archaeon]